MVTTVFELAATKKSIVNTSFLSFPAVILIKPIFHPPYKTQKINFLFRYWSKHDFEISQISTFPFPLRIHLKKGKKRKNSQIDIIKCDTPEKEKKKENHSIRFSFFIEYPFFRSIKFSSDVFMQNRNEWNPLKDLQIHEDWVKRKRVCLRACACVRGIEYKSESFVFVKRKSRYINHIHAQTK